MFLLLLDPNVYKTLTILLLTLAVITLAVIQFCRKRHLPFLLPFKICRETSAGTESTESTRKRPKARIASTSFTSCETSRSSKRIHEDNGEREVQANLLQEPNHVEEEHTHRTANGSSIIISENAKQEVNCLFFLTTVKILLLTLHFPQVCTQRMQVITYFSQKIECGCFHGVLGTIIVDFCQRSNVCFN